MDTKVAIPEVINTPFAGGFYAGKIMVAGTAYALIVAPKAEGETELPWNESDDRVTGAESFNDGAANTAAMLQAGSDLAKWAAGLNIDGYADWYIPSLDELEVIYRNLKPTTETNTLYARSGINASAIPPTMPYTSAEPAQTTAEAFQSGGDQAFADTWYWTSTQYADFSDCAWGQFFYDGIQGDNDESCSDRARAVRRLVIQ